MSFLQRSKTQLHHKARSEQNGSYIDSYNQKFNSLDRQEINKKYDSFETNPNIPNIPKPVNVNRPYSNLSNSEITILQIAALKRINSIFKKYSLERIDPSLLSSIKRRCLPPKKKWWEVVLKSLSKPEPSVISEYLCKSIEFASVPVDHSEHSFNIRRVPILVQKCISHLKSHAKTSEGIFRVSGSEKRIHCLIKEFNSPPNYGLCHSFDQTSVNDIGCILKKYIKSLPEPLLTSDLYPFFLNTLNIPIDNGLRTYSIRLLLFLLPPPHLVLLEYLLDLLSTIQNNSNTNQMTANNLGIVFAPCFLRPLNDPPIEDYQKSARVIEHMTLNYQQLIITHPSRDPLVSLEHQDLFPIPDIYGVESSDSSRSFIGMCSKSIPHTSQFVIEVDS